MKLRSIIFILGSLFILFSSCIRNKHEDFGKSMAKAFASKKYKNFDTTAYFSVFKDQLKKEKKHIHNPIWMGKIYDQQEKGLTLIGAFLIDGQLDSLNSYLNRSVYHGLNPDYFHASKIAELLEQVKETKFDKVEDSYPLLASLEILAADGLINYVNILNYGAVNPKNIFSRYFIKVDRPDFINTKKSLDQIDLLAFLEEVQPKNKDYKRLQEVLIKENEKLTQDQREKIIFSLERLRWLGKPYPEKYLLVNIPEFKLRIISNYKTNLEMKVCVGATDNPGFSKNDENHETPIISGEIDRMQVNPVWNIPKSIAGKEILKSLIADSSYLENNNMVAYDKSGKAVDAFSVKWSEADVNDFSFKQNPGADNSLGQIKFIFYNPYAIYLHDTPAKAAFGLTNRAVSHGCVRVEKPLDLAAFLLNDEKKTEKIKEEIAASTNGEEIKSRWVILKEPMPVFLAYYTAWINDDEKLITAPDVYGYDSKLKPYFEKFMVKLN